MTSLSLLAKSAAAAACLLLVACGPVAEPDTGATSRDAPGNAAAEGPAPEPEPARRAGEDDGARPWLDTAGTSILGFGLLRLVPAAGADAPAAFEIVYRDTPQDGYSITDNAQLMVLAGDAFARQEMIYAGDLLAFARTPPYTDPEYVPEHLELRATVRVSEETIVLVGYGPWTGPDTGRPPGDDPTFTLSVRDASAGAAHEWLESEAGELITTNWTLRPEIARGKPVTDPVGGGDLYLEIRPLILYDASLARSSDEPPAPHLGSAPDPRRLLREADELDDRGEHALAEDARERAADLAALVPRRDPRIVLTPHLTERFRRVPIRWR